MDWVVFINLGNVSGKNNDDFNIGVSNWHQRCHPIDGFLKSIMFISMGSFTDIIQRVAILGRKRAEQSRQVWSVNYLFKTRQTWAAMEESWTLT